MGKLYSRHDKVMMKETGEVFTVLEDLSCQMEPGIVVKEKVGLLLMHSQVRPAGHTRQRRDAAVGITEPDAPPPLPADRLSFEKSGDAPANPAPPAAGGNQAVIPTSS